MEPTVLTIRTEVDIICGVDRDLAVLTVVVAHAGGIPCVGLVTVRGINDLEHICRVICLREMNVAKHILCDIRVLIQGHHIILIELPIGEGADDVIARSHRDKVAGNLDIAVVPRAVAVAVGTEVDGIGIVGLDLTPCAVRIGIRAGIGGLITVFINAYDLESCVGGKRKVGEYILGIIGLILVEGHHIGFIDLIIGEGAHDVVAGRDRRIGGCGRLCGRLGRELCAGRDRQDVAIVPAVISGAFSIRTEVDVIGAVSGDLAALAVVIPHAARIPSLTCSVRGIYDLELRGSSQFEITEDIKVGISAVDLRHQIRFVEAPCGKVTDDIIACRGRLGGFGLSREFITGVEYHNVSLIPAEIGVAVTILAEVDVIAAVSSDLTACAVVIAARIPSRSVGAVIGV